MSFADAWGEDVAAESQAAVDAWDEAWTETLHFVGDPFATLSEPNDSDAAFTLGSVYCALYAVLGGSRFDDPELVANYERAGSRADSDRDRGHLGALNHLVRGDFTLAAEQWDALAIGTHDLAAVRFAHDIYLHVADSKRRLVSSQRAFEAWDSDHFGWNFLAGLHAFSLEESGHYTEAEELGLRALEADPLDLWALHCLAHVYESTDDSDAAIDLLRSRQQTWEAQDGLATHVWWHLGLRLIAGGHLDEALDLHDQLVLDATTAFRLCDLASLLWRLELAGVAVGDRWDYLADTFATRPERHTAAFLDLHQAMIYTRRPDHLGAQGFFEGVADGHLGTSENDQIFRSVAAPLCDAIRLTATDPAAAVHQIDFLEPQLHRIGGSVAQRDIITLTRNSLQQPDPEI